MAEGMINFDLSEDRPNIIKVIGVGGGGGNAVRYMAQKGIVDVDFVICNTDKQVTQKDDLNIEYIQIGEECTNGYGAGNDPNIGKEAAEESIEQIKSVLSGDTKMVFITAAMGGGTGTGAAPIIAKTAKDMGRLVVGVVTVPARFEGPIRVNNAKAGVEAMESVVDCLIVIENDRIKRIHKNSTLSHAFSQANEVLLTAAKGIAEIITLSGYINVDFADVKTVMENSGVAIMGAAKA
ncbi:MAG: cell division FtsZ family protein, partial [Odoribacter sp.]|nr:cell division FtsZ family protein [Odoribacter sp.]